MKLRYYILPFLALLVMSCSSDDSGITAPEEPEVSVASFIAVGEDASNVYQFNYDGTTEQGTQQNLTADFSINTGYLTQRQTDDLLSFYYFQGGTFSLIIKDIRTDALGRFSDIFANSEGRSVAWGTNTESNVIFGFFGPFGTRNLGIQDVSLQNNNVTDTAIDVDIDFVYQPLLFNERVYFAYRDNVGDYKFTFYDTANQSTGPILNFQEIPISFLITDQGEVAIVKNGVNATLEIYDAVELSLKEDLSLAFNTGFSAGPIDGAVYNNGVLFYAFPFVQPSAYPSGPATFNITSQENTIVDFISIAAEVESALGAAIGLTVQLYDADQGVFLVGYEVLDQSARGGVLQITPLGELVANVETPFVPTYFVRN